MKTLLGLLLTICCLSGMPATAQIYNPAQNRYDHAPPPRQQYNPMENRWETVQGRKELTYNPFENQWSYEAPDARPVYNPYEHKWEYAK